MLIELLWTVPSKNVAERLILDTPAPSLIVQVPDTEHGPKQPGSR